MIKNIFLQIRPKQQVKNFILFIPAIIDRNFTQETILEILPSLITFALVTILVYAFNDLRDFKNDQINKVKIHRPLASGLLKKNHVLFMMIAVAPIVGFLLFQITPVSRNLILIYFTINIFYSLVLKRIVYLELALVASGYLIRLLIGMDYVRTHPTLYFYICFLSFIFLILVFKRYSESDFNNLEVRKYDREELKILILVLINTNIISYLVYLGSLNIDWIEVNRIMSALISISMLILLNISLYRESMKLLSHSPENYIFKFKYVIICVTLYSTYYLTVI
jgi:4-hydroxybenzoate polyprenyltransferase